MPDEIIENSRPNKGGRPSLAEQIEHEKMVYNAFRNCESVKAASAELGLSETTIKKLYRKFGKSMRVENEKEFIEDSKTNKTSVVLFLDDLMARLNKVKEELGTRVETILRNPDQITENGFRLIKSYQEIMIALSKIAGHKLNIANSPTADIEVFSLARKVIDFTT